MGGGPFSPSSRKWVVDLSPRDRPTDRNALLLLLVLRLASHCKTDTNTTFSALRCTFWSSPWGLFKRNRLRPKRSVEELIAELIFRSRSRAVPHPPPPLATKKKDGTIGYGPQFSCTFIFSFRTLLQFRQHEKIIYPLPSFCCTFFHSSYRPGGLTRCHDQRP